MNNREKPPKQVEDAYLDALYARVRELDKDIKAWPFVWNWNLIQLAWRRKPFHGPNVQGKRPQNAVSWGGKWPQRRCLPSDGHLASPRTPARSKATWGDSWKRELLLFELKAA
jgi:hypothetical protein